MIGAMRSPAQQLVTVFGGSGFLGRYVVGALAKRGYRVLVATRRPDLANHLQPLGRVGQIHAVQANLRYPDSVRHAAARADHVVNLVGILQESGRQSFRRLQAERAAPDRRGGGAGRAPRPRLGARRRPGSPSRLCPHQGGGRGGAAARRARTR